MIEPTLIAPAFRACFADFKLVKTRGCAQLIFELPIEQADTALQTLGGLPRAATEVWAAICRLDPAKAASAPRAAPANLPPKERRPFKTLTYAQQAGIRCDDPEFHRFLEFHLEEPGGSIGPREAADAVRNICCVSSRSEITEKNRSAGLWRELDAKFKSWKHDVPIGEPVR